jgi:hypothetical protein
VSPTTQEQRHVSNAKHPFQQYTPPKSYMTVTRPPPTFVADGIQDPNPNPNPSFNPQIHLQQFSSQVQPTQQTKSTTASRNDSRSRSPIRSRSPVRSNMIVRQATRTNTSRSPARVTTIRRRHDRPVRIAQQYRR